MEAVPPIPIALTVLEMVQYAVNPWGLQRAMCTMFERVACGELIDEVRMSREVLMDVKRRDFVRLRFNELVHMVFTGKG